MKLTVDESKGEMICDECGGKGCLPPTLKENEYYSIAQEVCWKCQGEGVVDWVSQIMGKPPKPVFHGTSFCTSSSFYGTFGTSGVVSCSTPTPNISNQVIHQMTKTMSKKIDEEIIDNIIKNQQQTPEFKFMEEEKIDNGIVSKFMFYSNLKQKLKSKANKSIISRYFGDTSV